jgi:hypothetical protein
MASIIITIILKVLANSKPILSTIIVRSISPLLIKLTAITDA